MASGGRRCGLSCGSSRLRICDFGFGSKSLSIALKGRPWGMEGHCLYLDLLSLKLLKQRTVFRRQWADNLGQTAASANYSEDLCVQTADGDSLECGGTAWAHREQQVGTACSCSGFFTSNSMVQVWRHAHFLLPEMYYPMVSRVNREKSIPVSRSLLIGRVGGSYLIKQVPQHRSPGPWEEGQGALDEALEKPTQWPEGARKLHLNESSVHWLRTVTAAKWGCCQEVGPRKLSSCLELHFLTVWTQWANRLGVSVCRRRGLEWG